MKKPFLWVAACLLLLAGVAQATTVGHLEACYFCNAPAGNNYGFGVQDAPIFHFANTSGNDITNASFTILASGDNAVADTFNIGTIAAGASFDLFLGVTLDGGSGHTFFAAVAGGHDTSDIGPDSNAVQFEFNGLWNSLSVSSGVFAAGDSTRTTLDGVIAGMNFLGGPNGNDGPCTNCYFNADVIDFNTPVITGAVPEPGSLLLFGTGVAGLAATVRRRLSR